MIVVVTRPDHARADHARPGQGHGRVRLLGQPDFRRFWIADAVSQVGTRISFLALPLLAVLTLHASAFEVSVLRTAETAAFLLLGLQAGAWCDRVRARPVLVAADLGRAVALGSIPAAAAFGVLTLWHVYAAVLLSGALTVFFDVAHLTYLPRLVGREHLVAGNAALAMNASVAAVAAPGAAGGLVQVFTAPVAIAADALSYLGSALFLRRIRAPEPRPPHAPGRRLRREVAEGARAVFGDPVLRALAGCQATTALFQSAYQAVIVVFLVREVGLSAGVIGLLGSVGLVGAVLASALTRRLADTLGADRLMRAATLLLGFGFLLFALTGPGWRLAYYVAGGFVTAFCIIASHVVRVSAQQARCPDHLLGRVNATMTVTYWGAAPLGSLLGGALATAAGLRPTLWVCGAGVLLAALWLYTAPPFDTGDTADTGGAAGGGAGGQPAGAPGQGVGQPRACRDQPASSRSASTRSRVAAVASGGSASTHSRSIASA